MPEAHEQNRRSWNAVTPAHNRHKADQVAFFRAGGTTLFPDELELLGDIAGKDLLHLQCNCGQDTLSLAQLGANVTGVDISDAAVDFATTLSRETGIPGTFLRSDLFEWFDATTDTFDVVFTSYGTIGWLSDLDRWARGVAKVLRPGGRFVFVEFHPLIWSLGPEPTGYFLAEPIAESGGVNDYVEQDLAPSGFVPAGTFENPEPAVSYQWTVAQIVSALLAAGLSLQDMREYPHCNGARLFDGMVPLPGRRFGLPQSLPQLPLMLGLVASR